MDNPYQGNPGPYAWDNPDGNPNIPTHGMAPPVTLPSLSAALMPIMEPAAAFSHQNEGPVNNTSCGETFTGGHVPLSAGNPWPFPGAGSSSSNTLAPMVSHHENFTGLADSSTNFLAARLPLRHIGRAMLAWRLAQESTPGKITNAKWPSPWHRLLIIP